jgi:choline dehydrogenase-like flavoprotein
VAENFGADADSQAFSRFLRSFDWYQKFKRDGLGGVLLTNRVTDELGSGLELMMSAIFEMSPVDSNVVRLASGAVDAYGDPLPELSFGFSKEDQTTMDRGRELITESLTQLGLTNIKESPVMHWPHHQMGTTRMGDNPATSVVDANLRVHGIDNLFLASSGNWVTGGASNPTSLITAFAFRLGDHLKRQLDAGELPELVRADKT